MISRLFLLVLVCLLTLPLSQAASPTAKNPKIGLVLSGGGAKGLIYIPLLKAIDSLGLSN